MYSASKHAVKGFTDALRVEVVELDKAPVFITLIQPTAVNIPFPQPGRNYREKEPRLRPPVITPQQVAEAILKRLPWADRDIKVGAGGIQYCDIQSDTQPRRQDVRKTRGQPTGKYTTAPSARRSMRTWGIRISRSQVSP